MAPSRRPAENPATQNNVRRTRLCHSIGSTPFWLHRERRATSPFTGKGDRTIENCEWWVPLERKGYPHDVPFLRGKKKTPSELMPRVHRVICLLKRWLMATPPGAVRHKHLAYDLDEFRLRFNRRRSKSRGQLFFRLVHQAVAVEPAPCIASFTRNQAQNKTRTCRGYLSQADTHQREFWVLGQFAN